MALLALRDVSLAFGGPPLLDHAGLSIERGERVALLGRNGAGKSTFLKVLDGTLRPDDGEVVRQSGIAIARLDQEVPADLAGSVFDIVADGLGETGRLLARHHAASIRVAAEGSDAALRELARLHDALDAADAWGLHTRIETALSHLGLDPELRFEAASGGRKRQALLARALVSEPDLLLLDEPTNHLDIAAVEWMETFLVDRGITLVFVTHDRAFLRRVATRIVDLDRGKLVDWGDATYDVYLERKEAALEIEAREWEAFDRKLAKEEAWIRTGIKARRTRNEGRVRALERLRSERAARRARTGQVRLVAQEADRSGKLVLEAKDLAFAHGDLPIVRGFSTTIMRGDRIGVIGPNGSGKTTLLDLLLGGLTPDAGSVRHGTNLEIVHADQLREGLEPERSVYDTIGDGAEYIDVAGQRKHVYGYLQDFLFPPERARTPVGVLSGGERNRLQLARLFTRRFNVLVLDEPTNDLDVETLDLLESLLLDFSGTLLLVSHDRAFLDNVVTGTLVMEGDGRVGEYVGGYADWVRQRRPADPVFVPKAAAAAAPAPRAERRRKLTMREAKELAELPERIDALEQERAELYGRLGDPAFLRDGGAVADAKARLGALDGEVAALTARWEALETAAAG